MIRGTKKKVRSKRVRGHAKWAAMLLVVLMLGIAIEYIRLDLAGSTVTVTAPFQPQYSANGNPQSSLDLAAELSGITAFRQRYDTDGTGQKIALIDSGIDLSHTAFCNNEDGTRKVAVYQDYTDEGVFYTEAVQQNGRQVVSGGTVYQIGGIYNHEDQFYLGFLALDALCPRLWDSSDDTLAVLVTAVGNQYDCVYIDTNQNCDFTDEQPLYCYQKGGGTITVYDTGYPMSLAVTEIAADGRSVQISTDTLGHGTFLAGILAANGTEYEGLAPQTQLYVYKIFDKDGASSQMMLAQAITQAVQDGADCINLSLSIPKDEAILPGLRSALRSAEEANIPVISAVGNYGPGKNTIAYPAREASVIGVGSAAYPEQYLLDRAVMLEDSFIPDYSGRGDLAGSTAPLLVAPSGVLSTVPGWYKEQYLYDYGTSISAAIVTAAVSHLQESAQKGLLQDVEGLTVEEIQKLFAVWAKDLGLNACAQGYGALYMGDIALAAQHVETAAAPELCNAQPVVYQFQAQPFFSAADSNKEKNIEHRKELFWRFAIAQGQSQSWYLNVPDDAKTLEISLAVDTEQPNSPFEHLIAMGRCRMYLYNPDGKLVEATEYIGAAYGAELKTSDTVSVWRPQEGVWEIVITSADNLSLYNHLETTGVLHALAYI